ncbi:hypothetical protein [Thermogutta sp.]|uniref:hypothetical protein n=1 Tax=Thermogutta sp. TaxID=1962930 RepID=UPI0032203488
MSPFALLLCVLVVSNEGGPSSMELSRTITLPLTTRTFRTGTTPTVDRTGNPAAAYMLSKQVGELTMLWVTPNGVGLYEKLSQINPVAKKTNYEAICEMGLVPVVNLNPWTVGSGKGVVRNDGSLSRAFADPQFVGRLCEEARQVAARFRPEYFSIGNEVNSVYEWLGPAAFDDLASLEKALYKAVKAASPSTKVLVVVSYSQLVDLPGPPRFHLVDKLAGAYDVLGVTTYPWKKYATPQDIPADYYMRLAKHTDRPLGFTEIGWSSDPAQGGSEDEQVEFLMRFLELTKGLRLEFVNWAFLHDLPESSVTGLVVQRTHLGLGLRTYDGKAKKVWEYFQALHHLPRH